MLHVAADDARDSIEGAPGEGVSCSVIVSALLLVIAVGAQYRQLLRSMCFTKVIFGFPECTAMRHARGAREAVGLFRKEDRNPPTPGAKSDARPVSLGRPPFPRRKPSAANCATTSLTIVPIHLYLNLRAPHPGVFSLRF